MRVYVIDDTPTALQLAKSLLTRNFPAGQFKLTLIEDATEALQLLDQGPPPAWCLVDYQMPDPGTAPIYAKLHEKRIPYIVWSGDPPAVKPAGAFVVQSKDPKLLLKNIEALMKKLSGSYLHRVEAMKLQLEDEDLEKMGLIRVGKKVVTFEQFSKMKNLKIPGNLDLAGTEIRVLPEGLEVEGVLKLRGTKIRELPKGLKLGGSLDLARTPIAELPPGLKINGSLLLNRTKIKKLPAGLKVYGSLNLEGTPLKELPAGLKVGGDLYLDKTKITELPAGLKVSGYLTLTKTSIAELPAGLQVGAGLWLQGTKITELPDDLKVKYSILVDDPKKIKCSYKLKKKLLKG